jgi:hypothetical protein
VQVGCCTFLLYGGQAEVMALVDGQGAFGQRPGCRY